MTPQEANTEIRKQELVQWVMGRVEEWRQVRDDLFHKRWSEYYRLWRGFWGPEDKQKDQERSKLIAPALQQAIEMTVAEMEEAVFGRDQWIDIADDYTDPQQKQAALATRDQIHGDLEDNEVPQAISEAFLNGALYGNGIAKIMVADGQDGLKCWLEPVAPQNFVIDPSATCVNDALGVAHEVAVPRHKILKKQQNGVYYKTPVGDWNGEAEMFDITGKNSLYRQTSRTETVFITEYHGLVPKKLLESSYDPNQSDPIKDENGAPIYDDGELVEAIVTIGNKSVLLRDKQNPLGDDRAVVAYQHETVPNQFWGRGVSEKGYNPQKALDAELRARIDALGILAYPVVGFDASRLPRGQDTRLSAGKRFLFNGRPDEIMQPIQFGNLDPSIFQNSADLERMVQMGTGAMDSATPTDVNAKNATFGGAAMQFSSFIKRSKRTMRNVEDDFLRPIITKMLARYQMLEPDKYPAGFKFRIKAAMGIMAREVEQVLLQQVIQVIPPESPMFMLVLKTIIDNGATPNKGEILAAIDKMMTPDPNQQQQQQQQQQLQMQALMLQIEELKSKIAHNVSGAELNRAKAEYTGVQSDLEDDKVHIQAAQVAVGAQKNHMQMFGMAHDAAQNHLDRLHETHQTGFEQAHERHMTDQQQQHEAEMVDKQGDIQGGQQQKELLHQSKQAGADRAHEANQGMLSRQHETKQTTQAQTHETSVTSKTQAHTSAEAAKDRQAAERQAKLKQAAAKTPKAR